MRDRIQKLEDQQYIVLLEAQNDALLDALEAVEWVMGVTGEPGIAQWCPSCTALKKDGHRASCKTQAALGKGE